MTRYTTSELDAIRSARESHPDLSQRELATRLYWYASQETRELNLQGAANRLVARTESSIYGAIRRYDAAKNRKAVAA